MLTIKKIGVLVILCAIFFTPAGIEAKDKSFSVSPTAGILYGNAEEIVYKYPDQKLYLSELLWDLKPLVYVGLGADFGPRDPFRQNGFTAALSFKYGLPLETGILENRDWMNYSNNNLSFYSRHDAYSRSAFLLDVSPGYNIRLNNWLALKAYGEISFMRLSWSGKDGFGQYPPNTAGEYPPWDDSLQKTYFEGEVIRYTQNWFILAPGLSLTWKPVSVFSLAGNINYSPIIYCNARDDHLVGQRPRTYHDYLYFGHYLKGNVEFIFSPGKNMDLSLGLSYKHISGTRGDSYTGSTRISKGAGAGHSTLDLGIAVRLRPFVRN